ncbi:MAG: DNA gyrase inhibitor YacG [Rickettsiales bacterium]|nr:DNA gyrase inhibitor YacG [Rickettsiales bacterium]
MTTTCPICKANAHASHAPFCSQRCADMDLGRWVTGRYAIPVMEDDGMPDDDENGEA